MSPKDKPHLNQLGYNKCDGDVSFYIQFINKGDYR